MALGECTALFPYNNRAGQVIPVPPAGLAQQAVREGKYSFLNPRRPEGAVSVESIGSAVLLIGDQRPDFVIRVLAQIISIELD